MQTKPIFIGFAAAILILVIAAAAFFAGLYLGQRGYVADLQYQQRQTAPGGPLPQQGGQLPQSGSPQSGPLAGQPAPGGFAPAGGPPGAPSWPPDAMGRLVSLTADLITLDSPQGLVTISLSGDTRFTDELGNVIAASELQIGDVTAVFGSDAATLVMRLPPRPNMP